jgi:hypothetical protein
MEICQLDPLCQMWVQEPFGGRGCFTYRETFLCYAFPDWNAGQKHTAIRASQGQHFNLVQKVGGTIALHGLGFMRDHELAFIGPADSCQDSASLEKQACSYNPAAMKVSPDTTGLTVLEVKCGELGSAKVCFRNHADDDVPMVEIGVIIVGINVFDQYLLDLKHLRSWIKENKDEKRFEEDTRGLVLCVGGPTLLTNAYVTISALRVLGCRLPIEIFHLGQEEISSIAKSILMQHFAGNLGEIEFHDALEMEYPEGHETFHLGAKPVSADTLQGYMLKGFALLQSKFRHVMLFDADSGPIVNPTFLFDTPEYIRHGSMFWQDFWSGWVKDEFYGVLNITKPGNMVRDIEAGQFLMNKYRHWDVVLVTWFLNCHSTVTYLYQHGDKDTYPQAFDLLGKLNDFFVVPHAPRAAFMEADPPDGTLRLVGMLQPAIDGRESAFIHRTSTGKYQPYVDPTPIDWVTEPGLLTVEYNRKYLVDQAGPLTLGLKMKWIPPGMLDRPSKILQWHQRIALSAYQSFRLMLLSFEKIIPKGMKKAKLKTLKCPNAKSGDFGWVAFDRSCYKKVVVDYPSNMSPLLTDSAAAEMICEADRGSNLVWVASLDEHDFVYDLTSSHSDAWIGVMNALTNYPGRPVDPNLGWFHYNKKIQWNFTYWGPNQPINTNGSQLCAVIRKTASAIDDNSWVVQNCAERHEVICKVKQAKVWDALPGPHKPTVAPTHIPTIMPTTRPTETPKAPAPTPECLKCPTSGWTLLQRRCYQSVFTSAMTFDNAERHCVANYGHLAAISTAAKSAFINDLGNHGGPLTWIGFHRIAALSASPNEWVWTNENVNMSLAPLWARGQPTGSDKGCAAVMLTKGADDYGKWVAEVCATKLPFVCETDAEVCTSSGGTPTVAPTRVGEISGNSPSNLVMFHPHLLFKRTEGEVDYAEPDKTDFSKPNVEGDPELQVALRRVMAHFASVPSHRVPVTDVVIHRLIGGMPSMDKAAAVTSHTDAGRRLTDTDEDDDDTQESDLRIEYNVTIPKKLSVIVKSRIREAVSTGAFLTLVQTTMVELHPPDGGGYFCCVTVDITNPEMPNTPLPISAVEPTRVRCPTDVTCPPGWTLHCKTCYYLSEIQGTMRAVDQDCMLKGAHLATMRSAQEHDFIHQLVGDGRDSWVGLKVTPIGQSWTDGTSVFSPYMQNLVEKDVSLLLNCEDGWTAYGSRCYRILSDFRGTHDAVMSACGAEGGALPAIPETLDENQFLSRFVLNGTKPWLGEQYYLADYWLGITYNVLKARWDRLDFRGKTPTYGFDRSTLDARRAARACVSLRVSDIAETDGDAHWLAANCTDVKAAVCFKSAVRETCFVQKNNEVDFNDNVLVPTACNKNAIGGLCSKPADYEEEIRACPVGWSNYNTWCYMLLPTVNSSIAQNHACVSRGGHLASVRSKGENQFIYDIMLPGRDSWIGGSYAFDILEDDGDDEFGWLWYDRAVWKFSTWGEGQPKSLPRGKKLCVSMHNEVGARNDKKWLTADCMRKLPAVCKRDANVTALDIINKKTPTVQNIIPACKAGWTLFGRDCYAITGFSGTWQEHELECNRRGSHLASIASKQENDFVMSMSSQGDTWVGMNYALRNERQSTLLPKHGWVWADHVPTNFYRWGTGEPSNNGAALLCVALRNNDGHEKHSSWVVRDCERHLFAVCKSPATLSEEASDALDATDALNVMTSSVPCSACAPGWSCKWSKCFKFIPDLGSRAAQEANCKSFGGHLARAVLPAEEAYLYDLLPASKDAWIGASRNNGSGSNGDAWTWLGTDKTIKDTSAFWADNEPSTSASHNCAAIRRREGDAKDGLWIAIDCDANLPALCSTQLSAMTVASRSATPVASTFFSSGKDSTPCGKSSCQKGWTCFQHSCYTISVAADTFKAHAAHCRESASGGHIASVTSVDVEAIVHDLSPIGRDVWIGASRARDSDFWSWSDHDTTIVQDGLWAVGQPPAKSAVPLCAAVRNVEGDRSDGLWIALVCTSRIPAVCEAPRRDIAASSVSLSSGSGAASSSLGSPCDDVACPTGWTCFESSCYKLQPATSDHEKQESICSSTGGHLATVTTSRTELVLYDLCPKDQDIWIGATHASGSKWEWPTRDEVKTPIWGVNEPSSTKSDSCAAIRHREGDVNDGLWISYDCTKNLGAICEIQRQPKKVASVKENGGASSSGCPAKWLRHQHGCYLALTSMHDFAEAKEKCVSMNANLVSIRSEFEQEFISHLALAWQDTWIGLVKSSSSSNEWRWIDRTRWSFSNWGSGQPNYEYGCGALRRMEGNVNDGTWVAMDCGRKMYSICYRTADDE